MPPRIAVDTPFDQNAADALIDEICGIVSANVLGRAAHADQHPKARAGDLLRQCADETARTAHMLKVRYAARLRARVEHPDTTRRGSLRERSFL